MKSNRFEVLIEGRSCLSVTGVKGLESGPEAMVRLVRAVKPRVDLFRDWVSRGDERAVEVRLRDAHGLTVISWSFSARPVDHYYSDLDAGKDEIFTETIFLDARDIRVTDTPEEDELGEDVNFTAPLAGDPQPRAKPRAAELPVWTVIRTVERGGYPFVFEKADENIWYMTASTVSYPDSQVQVRIDSRETSVLYLPGNSA